MTGIMTVGNILWYMKDGKVVAYQVIESNFLSRKQAEQLKQEVINNE